MKAIVYFVPGDIRVEKVPDPRYLPEGVALKVGVCDVCNVI